MVIAVMLPFVAVAMLYAGQIAGTYVLGCKLTARKLGARGAMAAIVAGTLLVGSFFAVGVILWATPGSVRTIAVFFHLVGLLVILGLSLIGSGAFLLSRFGLGPRRSRRRRARRSPRRRIRRRRSALSIELGPNRRG